METAQGIFVFIIVICIAIGFRMLAGKWNHARIKSYIEARGGKVLKIRWEPFGPGCFAEKDSMIYEIRYLDREKKEHRAYCKTNLLSGVYLTEDRIIYASAFEPPKPTPTATANNDDSDSDKELQRLREENRQLRETIEKLKNS